MTLDRVFVYGTLKVGENNHPLIAPFVRAVTPGTVPGRLVDLGGYPGWMEGAGTVYGEVLQVAPADEALRILDELEEYFGPGDPENVYERLVAAVATPERTVPAWAYQYVGPTTAATAIPGGVWSAPRLG